MKGTIVVINEQRGMVAVQTENNDFSVFELLGGDSIELGDEVIWKNDTSLGSTILTNMTKGCEFEVFFQNHWVPKSQLRQQLLME
jgi:hypothetical protein